MWREKLYLTDIVDAAQAIEKFIAGGSFGLYRDLGVSINAICL